MIKTFEAFNDDASEEFYLSATKFIEKIIKYNSKKEPKNKIEFINLVKAISKLETAIKFKLKERVKHYMEVIKSIIPKLEN